MKAYPIAAARRQSRGVGACAEVLVALLALGLGCGGTLKTGTAKKPAAKPAADGSCPSGRVPCGTGKFAICVDLQSDANHCGGCEQTCSPGIACQAGACQQRPCTETTVPLSGQPAESVPNSNLFPGMETWRELLVDVNGDGLLDLVEWLAAYHTGGGGLDYAAFGVSLGQPGGGFAPPDQYHASAWVRQMFATDVNDDGSDDLYVLASAYANAADAPFRVELWLGQKDGRLTRSDAAGMSGVMSFWGSPSGIAMSDLSGDGWLDLIIPASGDEAGAEVFLSDAAGALHRSSALATSWVTRTFIRDWDGNGSPDVVVLSDEGGWQIFYNRGDGTFEPGVDCAIAVPASPDAVLVEDFDHDGRMDLAAGTAEKRVTVILGLGGCAFAPNTDYALPGSLRPHILRAVDMNGDGQLDIIGVATATSPVPNDPASVTTDNLLVVLLGNPDGTFQPQDRVESLGPDVSDLVVGEVSGDSRPDIVLSSTDGQTNPWGNGCQ